MRLSSRRELIKRILVYATMTISVIALVTALVFLMLGYRYNQQSKTFIQGGLVQFISQPEGARVKVDDIILANKTRSKITLNPGSYTITMSIDGYRDWQKQVSIKAGTVLWLNSAHFVPSAPETTSILDLPKLGSVAMQEDGRRISVIAEPTAPNITLITANDDTVAPKTISLASSQYSEGSSHIFSLIKQSGDNRHILLKHTYDKGKKIEWLIVDMDDVTKSYVIATDQEASVKNVQFDPSSSDRAYVHYSDGTMRRLDISSGEQSEVLAQKVADFTITSGGWVFYATQPIDGVVSTAYITQGKAAARTLDTFTTTKPVHIAAGTYYGKFYIVTSQANSATVRTFASFPTSDSTADIKASAVKELTVPSPVTFLSFKADGRFIALQQARSQTIYDLDLEKQSDVEITGLKKTLRAPIEWLDAYHFWDDSTGYARQYEFDGINQTPIVEVAPGFAASYSSNQKYFYSIAKTEKGYALQRTTMIIR